MKEIRRPAVAVFDENDKLIRVEIADATAEVTMSTAIGNAKVLEGADFQKDEKPAPVTLEVHGSNFRPSSKFNKTKP